MHARDIIYVKGGQLARITGVCQSASGVLTAQCTACERVEENVYRDSVAVSFVASHTIIDAVAYRNLGDGSFRVLLPFLARFH